MASSRIHAAFAPRRGQAGFVQGAPSTPYVVDNIWAETASGSSLLPCQSLGEDIYMPKVSNEKHSTNSVQITSRN
ncbi:hypothetical protein NPIL_125601 [Nephila pilipes]|uniref:Uncharacterized protein n=1 Tax=Nephila pilipes TaxID=299642 RepID=A0A8X6MVG3_NEPPI|nr:hypothetical protein NPIL_125601 [Nephila pilipes]